MPLQTPTWHTVSGYDSPRRSLAPTRTCSQPTIPVQPVRRPHLEHLDGQGHSGRPHLTPAAPRRRRRSLACGSHLLHLQQSLQHQLRIPVLRRHTQCPCTATSSTVSATSWLSGDRNPTSSTKRLKERAFTDRKKTWASMPSPGHPQPWPIDGAPEPDTLRGRRPPGDTTTAPGSLQWFSTAPLVGGVTPHVLWPLGSHNASAPPAHLATSSRLGPAHHFVTSL